MELTPAKGTGRYVSIKSDGLLHEKVTQDTEGAVYREYELKDGTKGSKWELLYKDIKNVLIKDIAFEDSDFGENILITVTDGENDLTLAESTSGNFGTDLMKKLPNVSFAEKLTIAPYAFTDEKTGKPKRGVTLYQNDHKIQDFFYDGETNLHGFPVSDKTKTYDKDDWKVYFISVKKFLVNYTKENVMPKLSNRSLPNEKTDGSGFEYPKDEINPEDVPF